MTDIYFRKSLAFDSSTDIGLNDAHQLAKLTESFPNLKVYTRSSPQFLRLKGVWSLQHSSNEPLAVIRVTDASQVSEVVKYCVANKLPVSVRSGGHDLWGRSIIADAVIIDIRELNSIELAEDETSVKIGCGTQIGPLVDFLDSHGRTTAVTLAGIVSYTGWAFSGGFGPLINTFGLGVDQIVGAKVITADGQMHEAIGELLWAIKGAGGAFGVITEITIKTYPLPNMLGGMLMFPFEQAGSIVANLQTMLEKETVPAPFSAGFHFSKRGGQPVLIMLFSWASPDIKAGQEWLAKVKTVGPILKDMVAETTIKKWSDSMGPMLPPPSHNTSRSFFISKLTPPAVDIFMRYAECIPDGLNFAIATFLVFGEAIRPTSDSCFPLREPYVFLHALAPVQEESRFDESRVWTSGIAKELMEAGLVRSNYLAIMGPEFSTEDYFGKENFERLTLLKKQVDPGNVFASVPAKLTEGGDE